MASISGTKLPAVASTAVFDDRSCAISTSPGRVSRRAGSSGSGSMVTWEMSPTVRETMKSASPPMSADMKMKMKTPTATPETRRAVCAIEAVR